MAGKDVIWGKNPVLEALANGMNLEKILVSNSSLFNEIRPLTRGTKIIVQHVPPAKLDRVTRKNHQGIVAFLGFVEYQDLDNIIAQTYEQGETPLLLALDGVTDVGNMGAIARSAWAMGVHGIIVPEKGSALINGVAVKASAGAIQQVNFCKISKFKNTLKYLQENGIQVLATTLAGDSIPVNKADFTVPCCIVMGNEEKGVGTSICELADHRIHIPMARKFDSLNVSVATGIVLNEVLGQRMG